MNISNNNGLKQALAEINSRKSRDFSVPLYSTLNRLSSIETNHLKAKLYDNRHGLTDFQYDIREIINARMNFTQRL